MDEKYSRIEIKAADNGWMLCYEEKKVNPMANPDLTFESKYIYEYHKEVFEGDAGLDKALARQKELLLELKEKED